MVSTILNCGIQKVAEGIMDRKETVLTVGQQIERLIEQGQTAPMTKQTRATLRDPRAVIEVRSGDQLQIVTPMMPLREVMDWDVESVEITVSEIHVGG